MKISKTFEHSNVSKFLFISASNLHWVVAEDSASCSHLVSSLLARMGVPYTHLASPQPALYRTAKLKLNPRGVSSRRAGLHWVLNNSRDGVVYFADDDNTYDFRLFKEIATTQRISMFPVGFIGGQVRKDEKNAT